MKSLLTLLILSIIVAIVSSKTQWNQLDDYTFEQYTAEFKKYYIHAEYDFRKSIFENRMKEIKAHNQDPTRTWKQGVNDLTDRTEDELKQMRGLIKHHPNR